MDDVLLDQQIDQSEVDTLSGYRALVKAHDAKLTRDYRGTLAKGGLKLWNDMFEGDVPLKYMAPAVREEFGDRIEQLVINIPRFGVEAVENRLDIDGIRTDPSADADDTEQSSWADLDMDLVTQQVHLETLGVSRAFAMVGTDEDGSPLVTPESAVQVTCFQSNQTRATTSAVKRWKLDDGKTHMRTLLLPNENATLFRDKRGVWQLYEPVDGHNLGRVLMVPFSNKARILDSGGVPEFKDVIPLYEALNKIATDMMVAAEVHAIPRRWVVGVSEGDFEDELGKKVSAWEQVLGKVWAVPGGDKDNPVTLGQFNAADLTNFHNTIKQLLQIATSMLGLPPHYAGLVGDNPASADAIRSSEAQLVKRAERKQTVFGASWKKVWQLVMAIRDGNGFTSESKRVELIWRDAATPTIGMKADAVVKLTSGDNPIYSAEYAREQMGVRAGARDRIVKDLEKQAQRGTALIRDALNPA